MAIEGSIRLFDYGLQRRIIFFVIDAVGELMRKSQSSKILYKSVTMDKGRCRVYSQPSPVAQK